MHLPSPCCKGIVADSQMKILNNLRIGVNKVMIRPTNPANLTRAETMFKKVLDSLKKGMHGREWARMEEGRTTREVLQKRVCKRVER